MVKPILNANGSRRAAYFDAVRMNCRLDGSADRCAEKLRFSGDAFISHRGYAAGHERRSRESLLKLDGKAQLFRTPSGGAGQVVET